MTRLTRMLLVWSYEDLIESAVDEEKKQHYRSYLKLRWPGEQTYYPETEWNKRYLVQLYEDLSFNGYLTKTPEAERFIRVEKHQTKMYRSYLENDRLTYGESVFEKVELFWRGAAADDHPNPKPREDLFERCNWHMPLLRGSQHNNRFKRNTKVYVMAGEEKGRHGVVVGHEKNFDLKAWGTPEGKSPLLYVVFARRYYGHLEVKAVRQDLVMLVDLHGFLPFAVPILAP